MSVVVVVVVLVEEQTAISPVMTRPVQSCRAFHVSPALLHEIETADFLVLLAVVSLSSRARARASARRHQEEGRMSRVRESARPFRALSVQRS